MWRTGKNNPYICYQDIKEGKWDCYRYLHRTDFDPKYYRIDYIPYSKIHKFKVPMQGWYIYSKIKRQFLKQDYKVRERINGGKLGKK